MREHCLLHLTLRGRIREDPLQIRAIRVANQLMICVISVTTSAFFLIDTGTISPFFNNK